MVYYRSMKEARSAIIITLILLFIIVGVGVAISRVAKKEVDTNTVKTEDQRGFLERVFLKSKDTKITKKTTTTDKKMVITSESKDIVEDSSVSNNPGIYSQSESTELSDNPGSIPATGTPTFVVLSSLAGLASGFYIKKRS